MLNEYGVVARDFYREHKPELYKITANNEEEAADLIFRRYDVKEILDVKPYNEINWNNEITEKYWLMYASIETVNMFKRQ